MWSLNTSLGWVAVWFTCSRSLLLQLLCVCLNISKWGSIYCLLHVLFDLCVLRAIRVWVNIDWVHTEGITDHLFGSNFYSMFTIYVIALTHVTWHWIVVANMVDGMEIQRLKELWMKDLKICSYLADSSYFFWRISRRMQVSSHKWIIHGQT